MTMSKMEEDNGSNHNQEEALQLMSSVNNQHGPGMPGAGMQISSHPDDVGGARGIRTLTMTNHNNPNSGATILQYAASSDGQFYLPMTVSSNVESYMSSSSSNTPTGVVGAGSPHGEGSEESLRKRQLRLLKNREAARECRRKKKEYVKCLENRVAVLENQNKTLIEEMKAVKDLYFYLEG